MYGIKTVLDLAENEDPELVSWHEDERAAAWYSKQSSLNLPGDLNSLVREMPMSRRDRRRAALDGNVTPVKSLLLRSSMAEARNDQ